MSAQWSEGRLYLTPEAFRLYFRSRCEGNIRGRKSVRAKRNASRCGQTEPYGLAPWGREDNGAAIDSNDCRSALTPRKASTMAASTINPPPKQ
jgi:hypothetical protein